jgi:hypothetical protein
MNPSSRLHPEHMAYPSQGPIDQTGQGRVRRMDSTSGTSHSSHHSSVNSHSNNQNGASAKRYPDYTSSNGHANLVPQPASGQAYRSNQYQMSPRSSRTDLRERDRDHGAYSPASHPSSPSLPYPPGSGPSTPTRPYSSQHHPFQYVQHAVQMQPGEIVTSNPSQGQGQPRPPYPYLNQPPVSPHSAGPNLSPGLSAVMSDLRMPQRSATDPQQWDEKRNRYEDGGRSRSRTMYPAAGEDTYGSYGGQNVAASQGRGNEGLGLGPVEGNGQLRDRSPNRSYGVPGPGPNTERQNHNPNNLRIAPPSPSRKGRRSPNRSPTTPSSGNMPNYMQVPLPPGSDQSHQSISHINVTSPNGHVEAVQPGQVTRNPRNLSPTAGHEQGYAGRPYDVHTHGNFASTAPGPPVRRGSERATSNPAGPASGTMTPSTSGTLTASNTTGTYSSTSATSFETSTSKAETVAPGGQDAKTTSNAVGTQGSRAAGSGGSGGTLPSGSICGSCTKPVKRQFVRAMGKVYHLDCFRCKVSPDSPQSYVEIMR